MSTEKQKYFKEKYIKDLKEAKETYKKRKEFIKGFSLFPELEDLLNGEIVSDDEESSDLAGGTGVIINGQMPTIAQYNGPDRYVDPAINAVYQSGIKAKIKGTDRWNDDILEKAQKTGVNPLAVKIIMATESGGRHSNIPNGVNCVGLMQCMGSITRDLGRSWDKTRNDPVYNIETGCLIMKHKHEYAKGIIKRGRNPYKSFKARGAELKATVHGVAWLYNGFTYTTSAGNKVRGGGYSYGNQVAAMYAGFGRNAHADTVLTTDVLRSNSGGGSSSSRSSDFSTRSMSALSEEYDDISFNDPDDFWPIMQPPTDDELDFLASNRIGSYPQGGSLIGETYSPPQMSRSNFILGRFNSSEFQNKKGFRTLPDKSFIHLGGPQENFYSSETADMLIHLRRLLGYEYLIISRGFEVKELNSSHSIGIAVDIKADTAEEALYIADTAWLMGIRSIAIGPGFVHVDAGPENVWSYQPIPCYRGPGTVGLRELMQSGY